MKVKLEGKRATVTEENFKEWNEEMARRYDPEFYHEYSALPIRLLEKERVRLIIKLLGKIEMDEKVLEVGCGAGNILKKVDRGKMFGIDLSFRMIEKSKIKLEGKDVKLLKCYAERMPFKDGSFDKIICTEVLEHVLDPNLILDEIKRIAKREAVVVLTIPHERNIELAKNIISLLGLSRFFTTDHYQISHKMTDEWHLHHFDFKKLEAILGDKFTILKKKGIPLSLFPSRYIVKCEVVKE